MWKRKIFVVIILILIIIGLILTIKNRTNKPLSSNQTNTLFKNLISQIDMLNLQEIVLKLQSYGNRYKLEKQWEVARWIMAQLEEYGYDVAIQIYDHENHIWPNVIARKKEPEKQVQ